jgi:hypothetical protein
MLRQAHKAGCGDTLDAVLGCWRRAQSRETCSVDIARSQAWWKDVVDGAMQVGTIGY